MFNWFKDKFKKKDDKEIKEDLIEEKLSEEVAPKEDADEEIILTNEEIREEEAQELEEIEEKLEEASEEGKLSDEDIDNSEKIEDAKVASIDKEVVEEALDKEEEIQAEEVQKEREKIREELEEASEERNLSEVEAQEETKEANDNEEVEEVEEIVEEPKKVSLFQRLKEGLDKTRKEVGIKINTVLGAYVKIDDEMLEDLEDILISADIGMETTMKLIDNLRETIIREKINDPKEVKPLLMEEAKKLMNPELNTPIKTDPPVIILVVGVNGVGKTTTIGKLSSRFKREGKSVLVCAADTFRAAAIDQLKEWGNRAHVDIISHAEGSDPAAVVFDAIEAAKARKTDVLIVDTAGRLHNKSNLMKELEKINRIISNKFPEANRENLLVLDSTTGQNAINQAKTFREATDITGIALTKLDGTAKGGVVVALQSELGIPIKLIGVGEGIDDLQDFNIDSFLETIFG